MHNRLTTDAKPVRMESGCGLGCLCLTALTAEYAVHHYPPGASPAAAQHEARPLHSGVHREGCARHVQAILSKNGTSSPVLVRVYHWGCVLHSCCVCHSRCVYHSRLLVCIHSAASLSMAPLGHQEIGGGGSYGVTHTTHAGPKSRKVGPACPDNRPGSGCRWILGGFTLIFRNMVRVMISALKIGPNFGTK